MKKVLVSLMLLAPSLAQAQEAEVGLYYQSLLQKEGVASHRVSVEGYTYFRNVEKAGVWGFVWSEKGYLSAVGGLFSDLLTFGPDMVLEFGVGVGVEAFDDSTYARFGSFVLVGNEKLFSEWYFESGGSDEDWLRVNTLWQASKSVAVGVFHQTGDGLGPRVMLSIPKTPLRVWASPMFGAAEGRRFLVGGELIFKRR